jgi:hypothetical protein
VNENLIDPPAILYHYTHSLALAGIFRHRALWPSPPLQVYGLSRQEVESSPARFGFREGRCQGRRSFVNRVPHPGCPGFLFVAAWFEGQVFDVSLTRADWCYSVMSYFPETEQEGGAFWRLVLDTEGLDLCGWLDYQRRANVPAAYRRILGERTRKVGDDPHDWFFYFGELPLGDRLVELEQYHRGRWTRMSEVCERVPLAEMRGGRRLFEATFERAGKAPGLLGASLFREVTLDRRLVADHVWVQQTWSHLRPDGRCRFIATVVSYRRKDSTEGWTLGDVNGLEVL